MPSVVAIVILNWNGKHFLQQFLPSVVKFSENAQIYVVDNHSTDDSVSFLKHNFPTITIVLNRSNLGFCGGYNAGLKHIKSDYYVLLNNDVEVTEGWLLPIEEMEKNNKIGISQPKLLDYNSKNKFEYAGACGGFLDNMGYPYCRGRILEKVESDFGQYNTSLQITWATGACLFIRSELFWLLDGFDEDFFAHMEEIDLCWRAQHLGYEIWTFPKSTVYHVGGGTLHKSNPKKTYLNFKNGLFLLHKNLPQWYFPLIIFLRLCFDGLAGVNFLFKGQPKNFFAVIRAHFAYYASLSLLNVKRKRNGKKISVLSKKSIVWQYFIRKKQEFSAL